MLEKTKTLLDLEEERALELAEVEEATLTEN